MGNFFRLAFCHLLPEIGYFGIVDFGKQKPFIVPPPPPQHTSSVLADTWEGLSARVHLLLVTQFTQTPKRLDSKRRCLLLKSQLRLLFIHA